jgi:hypothetical protein
MFELEDDEGKMQQYVMKSERYISYEDDSSVPEGKLCSSIFAPLDIRQEHLENLFILGDAFIELNKVFFDRDRNKVGIATAKHAESLY